MSNGVGVREAQVSSGRNLQRRHLPNDFRPPSLEPSREFEQIMFQLFLRARLRNLTLGSSPEGENFKVRSPERDEETDRQRVADRHECDRDGIERSRERAKGTEPEGRGRAGARRGDCRQCERRVPGSGAAGHPPSGLVQRGNFERREAAEIARRYDIHFKFLRAAVLSRFPDYKAPSA